MAEKKKAATPKTSRSPAVTGSRKKIATVTNRSGASRTDSPSNNQRAGRSTRRPTTPQPSAEAIAARAERKNRFLRSYLPYILGAIALFLAVCFVVNIFAERGGDPDQHPMGVFGYYICHGLFGCLTWVAYLIPAVLTVLTIFWQRYFRTGKVVGKLILSVVLLLLLSSLTHVIACTANADLAETLELDELFETGASFESGGVIGGLLGYLLFWALRLPGTIVVTVITLPLIIMALVGVTPRDVYVKLRELVLAGSEDRAERRALRAEQRAEARRLAEEAAEERRLAEEAAAAAAAAGSAGQSNANAGAGGGAIPSPVSVPQTGAAQAAVPAGGTPVGGTPSNHTAGNGTPDMVLVSTKTGEVVATVPVSQPNTPPNAPSVPTGGQTNGNRPGTDPAQVPAAGAAAPTAQAPAPKPAQDPVQPIRNPVQAPVRATEQNAAPAPVHSTAEASDPVAVTTIETAAEQAPPKRISGRAVGAQHPPHSAPIRTQPEPEYEDEDDETVETLQVDLDEEEPAPTTPRTVGQSVRNTEYRATSGSGVHYEVVTDQSTAPAHAADRVVTDVRIHRPDTTAMDEKGLSEEEVVIPSGSGQVPGGSPEGDPAGDIEREYVFPSVDMLTRGPDQYASNDEEIAENTQILREVLQSFRIGVREISCSCGPTITRFEVKPDTGVRVRSIANLVDDIAMGLAKAGVRIEAPIPGKSAVGIEVPNADPDTVYLRNILETPEFQGHKSRIAACLGADVAGRPVILDINKMPHLLIAGATGTGKSVCINSLIMSILYKAKPDEVKLILIDPKKVEFAMYRELPHLYCPVVSDPKKAAGALNSAVNEMERRFELIEEVGVRNLAGYNEITAGDPERPPLPQMVIIIDELADLMMTAPAEVETAICRLAQKARAAGIHLIIGTQRPSVDVITGLIKANVPSRIAFTVKSGVDSRTILDTVGADKLIGRGDMLYAPIGCNKPIRAQGCFVSETEVERVVTFIKENNDGPEYNEEFARSIDLEAAKCGGKKKGGGGEQLSVDDFDGIGGGNYPGGEDPKFWEALEIAVTKDKIGTSALQRGCNLGYGRAAKIIDRMEELGFVGPDPGTKQGRKVLISKQDLMEYKLNGLPGAGSDDEDDEGSEE